MVNFLIKIFVLVVSFCSFKAIGINDSILDKELSFADVLEETESGGCLGSDIAISGQVVYRGMRLSFSELEHILKEGIESPIVYQWKQASEEIQKQSEYWSINQDPKKHAISANLSIIC